MIVIWEVYHKAKSLSSSKTSLLNNTSLTEDEIHAILESCAAEVICTYQVIYNTIIYSIYHILHSKNGIYAYSGRECRMQQDKLAWQCSVRAGKRILKFLREKFKVDCTYISSPPIPPAYPCSIMILNSILMCNRNHSHVCVSSWIHVWFESNTSSPLLSLRYQMVTS